MKNRSSFLFILLFCASIQLLGSGEQTSCSDQKNCKSRLLKKAWEHKKKIIATAITAAFIFCFCKKQKNWDGLYDNFVQPNSSDAQKAEAANALVNFTHDSWFMPKDKKAAVAQLIQNNRDLFPGWKTMEDLPSERLTFAKK
jgi:hypothetical protein